MWSSRSLQPSAVPYPEPTTLLANAKGYPSSIVNFPTPLEIEQTLVGNESPPLNCRRAVGWITPSKQLLEFGATTILHLKGCWMSLSRTGIYIR